MSVRWWRLKSARKIVFIGLLPVFLLAAPTVLIVLAGDTSGSRLRRESSGLTAANDILSTVQWAQRHRTLVAGPFAPPDAMTQLRLARAELAGALERTSGSIAALDDSVLTERAAANRRDLEALVADTGQASRVEAFARHTWLIGKELALLDSIAAASGLNVHRAIAGHHAVLAAVQHLPAMTEAMAQLDAVGAQALARPRVTEADRVRLATLAGEMEGNFHTASRSIELAMTADSARGAVMAAAFAQSDSSARTTLRLVTDHFVAPSPSPLSPADYSAIVGGSIDAQYTLMRASLATVHDELAAGIRRSQRSIRIITAVLGVLLLFTVLAIVALVRTDRFRREGDLRFQSILDGAPDGIVIADELGRIRLVNRAAERMFGFTQATAAGTLLSSHAAPDARASIDADLAELHAAEGRKGASGVSQSREFNAVRTDGTSFPLEVTRSVFREGEDRWTISVVRDVSARRSLEMQLQQSQKMEAIGQLTGGVAHDFNNLLGVVIGNLDLIEGVVAQTPAALKRVQTAQKAALRAADLTKRLLAFSRKQHLEPAAIRVDDCIANLVEMATRTLGPHIKIVTDITPNVPLVFADPGGLENVLLNLAVNARDAMPDGGQIAIVAGPAELDERHPAVRSGDVKPGRYVSLRVSDTGQGIPRDKLERVFEPFFTTKAQGKGTGLGLSMVYGFVKQTGGNVKIYSEVGVGTTISLILPIADAASEPVTTGTHITHRTAHEGATVLVVDDEPDLLDIAAAYLEEMGYRVLQANDGPEALRTLEREEHVDLLMTDVLMPGMNGVKLTQHVRAARPEVKVVFTSGFPAQALAERSSTAVDGPLLNKPFLKREFSAVVNRVMEGELV